MTDYALQLSDEELGRYRMMASFAAAAEEPLWAAAGIVPGARVIDLGCGPGAVLVELARRVAQGGRAVGVDQSAEAVATATAMIAAAGVDNAEARQGDATATGLEPGAWDAVMVRHVLAHNPPATVAAILAHVRELLKPGGHAFLVDSDGGMFRFERHPDPAVVDLTDRYVEFLAGRGCDTSTGPHLAAYAQDAGLEVVARNPRVEVVPLMPGMRPPAWAARQAMREAGVCTDDDIARWGKALDEVDAAEERNTLFGCMFTVTARRLG